MKRENLREGIRKFKEKDGKTNKNFPWHSERKFVGEITDEVHPFNKLRKFRINSVSKLVQIPIDSYWPKGYSYSDCSLIPRKLKVLFS